MEYKDYYKVLGVAKTAPQADIKKKYRKLALQFHPDKNQGNAESERRFKEISEAYDVIGDLEKRKKYDELGANWKQYDQYAQPGRNANGTGRSQSYSSGDFDENFGGGGFSDFFNAFFSGGFSGGDSSFAESRQRTARRVNTQSSLPLTFDEAFNGVAKVIDIEGERIRLNIKPGATDAQKLKVSGKGRNGGDLYITLSVGKAWGYEQDGLNLSKKVVTDLYTAVLGGKINVDTPHGKISLPIASSTQSGKKLRLKGKGFPEYNNKGHFGDLIIEVIVEIPKNLSPEQEALFEQLRDLQQAGS